jgi:hypothetical protein
MGTSFTEHSGLISGDVCSANILVSDLNSGGAAGVRALPR